MNYSVTQETFTSLASYWADSRYDLNWNSVSILPGWLEAWWQAFGSGAELHLRAVRQGENIIGVAPLLLRGGVASIVGSADVCDYLDFVIAPGKESDFFTALLDNLKQEGINNLDLKPLRPDSTVLTHLIDTARNRKYEVLCQEEEVTVELDLPATWDEYLAILTKKQRHEVRRKLRRLQAAGNIDYRCIEVSKGAAGSFMDTFLELFSKSREEKANFMSPKMESFFRSLAETMAEVGLLRSGIVELDTIPIAMTMGFDYRDSHYLYNSAYDPHYNSLSVGLLCKVLCLKESIKRAKKKWDFLKGGEHYKYQLGGREVPLYRCQITIR